MFLDPNTFDAVDAMILDDEYLLEVDVNDEDIEYFVDDEEDSDFLYGIVPGEDPLSILLTF